MIRKFQHELLAWFDSHARDLPWRQSSDPYRIWVSEIMLQQTRVTAVLDYYARFLALFPSVAALAHAEEPAVLAAWSGLGYYRRAKMMHQAAQVLVREHQGVFPHTDTSVVQAKWLRDRAASLLNHQRPGDFNQSMMELGATICLPQRPLCLHCPVQPFCKTRGEHQAPPPKKMRSRQIAYALLRRHHAGITQVLLHQRPPSASLMPGMWELPEIEMLESDHKRVEVTLRHAITVTNYRVHVLSFSEQEAKLRWPSWKNPQQWTKSSELST